jgi:hypothetical protein
MLSAAGSSAPDRLSADLCACASVNTTPLRSLARSLCSPLPGPLRPIACQQICARVPPSTRLLCVRWLAAYALRCRVFSARSLASRSVRVCLRIATLLSRAPSCSAAQRRCPPFCFPPKVIIQNTKECVSADEKHYIRASQKCDFSFVLSASVGLPKITQRPQPIAKRKA